MLTANRREKPRVGDIWQDRMGHHNLILAVNPPDDFRSTITFATLTLETGERWDHEELKAWADVAPAGAQSDYEKPFYHTRVA